jgi:hypothetical protein
VLDAALSPRTFRSSVDNSEVQGHVTILGVHSCGKTCVSDVDCEKIARRTPGFGLKVLMIIVYNGVRRRELHQEIIIACACVYVYLCNPVFVNTTN